MSHSTKHLKAIATMAAGTTLLLSAPAIVVAKAQSRGAVTTLQRLPKSAEVRQNDVQRRLDDLETRLTTLERYVYHGAPDACTNVHTNLETVVPGFKCRTSKGASYERVSYGGFKNAWKGPAGLIWDNAQYNGTLEEAKKKCASLRGKLPSKDDYQNGYDTGFIEVIPPDLEGVLWTSTQLSFERWSYDKRCVVAYEWAVVPNVKKTGELNSARVFGDLVSGCPARSLSNDFRCVKQSAGNDYVDERAVSHIKAIPPLKTLPHRP